MTTPIPTIDTPTPPAEPRSTRRRVWIAVIVLVVLAVAAIIGARVYTVREIAQAREGLAAQITATENATKDLEGARVYARRVYDASAGQVDDDQVRVDLKKALDVDAESRGVLQGEGSCGLDWWPFSSEIDDICKQTAQHKATETVAIIEMEALVAQAQTVLEARNAYLVDQAVTKLDAADAALTKAIATAKTTLAGSAGKVVDDGVRTVLMAQITEAGRAQVAPVPRFAEGIETIAAFRVKTAASLVTATNNVVNAQVAWQKAQDEAAAAAAAQRATQERASAPASGSGSAPRYSAPQQSSTPRYSAPKSSSGAPKQSAPQKQAPKPAPAPKPKPAPEPERRIVVEEGPEVNWCGGTNGKDAVAC